MMYKKNFEILRKHCSNMDALFKMVLKLYCRLVSLDLGKKLNLHRLHVLDFYFCSWKREINERKMTMQEGP